jgi:hypothetical protein
VISLDRKEDKLLAHVEISAASGQLSEIASRQILSYKNGM